MKGLLGPRDTGLAEVQAEMGRRGGFDIAVLQLLTKVVSSWSHRCWSSGRRVHTVYCAQLGLCAHPLDPSLCASSSRVRLRDESL